MHVVQAYVMIVLIDISSTLRYLHRGYYHHVKNIDRDATSSVIRLILHDRKGISIRTIKPIFMRTFLILGLAREIVYSQGAIIDNHSYRMRNLRLKVVRILLLSIQGEIV